MSRKPPSNSRSEKPCADLSPVGGIQGPWDGKSGTGTVSSCNFPSIGLNRSDDFFDSRSLQLAVAPELPSSHGIFNSSPKASGSPVGEQANSVRHFHSQQPSCETPDLSSRSATNRASGATGGVESYFPAVASPRVGSRSPSDRSPRLDCTKETSSTADCQSTASSGPTPQTSGSFGYSADSGSTSESSSATTGCLLWETPSMTRHAKREWRRPDATSDMPATPQSVVSREAGRSAKARDPMYACTVFTPKSSTGSRADVERSPEVGFRQTGGRNVGDEPNLPGDEGAGRIARFCSTGSLFNMTGTIVAPNTRKLISAVAAILLDQMEEDQNTVVDDIPEFHMFDEEYYLAQGAGDCPVKSALSERLREAPEEDEISAFITSLYEAAEFSPECNILCLLYINRLMAFTGMPLLHRNWRPLVFTALILAQKVWDDKFLGNSDFAAIYPFFSKEEINRMEAAFLKLVQYEVVVKPSTYAQYYFELRSMFQDGEDFPSEHPKVIANSGLEGRSLLLAERLSGRGVEDKSLTSI